MIPTSGNLRKNHSFWQGRPKNRWKTEALVQAVRPWNYSGDFRPFPTEKRRNLAGRHQKNPKISRLEILLP
jgi:hypothetical protein